jgi:single-stranded DNA-binding protein
MMHGTRFLRRRQYRFDARSAGISPWQRGAAASLAAQRLFRQSGAEEGRRVRGSRRFWAPVELWHRDAERYGALYRKGMRVLVDGRVVREEWEDAEGNERVSFKIEARRVGILPHRIESVALLQKPKVEEAPPKEAAPPTGKKPRKA